MWKTRIISLAAALCCAAAILPAASAAQVESGSVYCFSPEDFGGEDLAGICLTALPRSSEGAVMLGSRALRPGDVLTLDQAAALTFSPVRTEEDGSVQVSYLPIGSSGTGPEATMTIGIRGRENLPPVAQDSALETYKNLEAQGNLKASDPEGEEMTFTVTKLNLPRFVKGLDFGVDERSSIHEHVATLLTEQRIQDINSILAIISTKCEFSQGQFVLDEKTGMVTATEINADCQETIQTITDIRSCLKTAIKNLCYAIDAYCDIYGNTPKGYVNVLDESSEDDDIFYFDDLVNSFEEDRTRAYNLASIGVISWETYLTRFEGFSQEDAKNEIQKAKEDRQQPRDIYEE